MKSMHFPMLIWKIGIDIITEYSESLVRRMIEKITVYDDHFVVEFKSGIEITINE